MILNYITFLIINWHYIYLNIISLLFINNIIMENKYIDIILQLMWRVELKGTEVPTYIECMNFLHWLKKEKEEVKNNN